MPRVRGKQSVEVAVVSLRCFEGVERLLFFVVVTQRHTELVQRIDTLPRCDQWPLPGDFAHQLIDIFKLLERRPPGIARPPVRTRPQPDSKRLGEIFVGVALCVPEPKVLDITPTGWIGPVIPRVAFRGRAEQLLPAPASVQLVGVLHGMPGFVTEDGHTLGPSAALDIEHYFLLEPHQTGVGKIKRDRNAGRAIRTEPLARYPRMWPQPDVPLRKFFMETVEALLEPGAFNFDPQSVEAALE